MEVEVSTDEREAAQQAAVLLRHQARGLADTGSQRTVAEIERYLATLEKIANSAGRVEITPEEKIQIERAAFLLQGLRSGLESADFHSRANVVQTAIDCLEGFVADYNGRWADQPE